MKKVQEIVTMVEKESPGLLDRISQADGITKEELVRKVLALSRGQMVRTHQNKKLSVDEGEEGGLLLKK